MLCSSYGWHSCVAHACAGTTQLQVQHERMHTQVGVSGACLSKLTSGTFAQLAAECGGACDDKCAVCQEQFGGSDMLTQLPCKHNFHQDCIGEWLQGSKMCPVCMREVTEAAPPAEQVCAEPAAEHTATAGACGPDGEQDAPA